MDLNTPETNEVRRESELLASERVDEITKEFTAGFKFLEDYPRSVTFFGSTQFKEGNPYYDAARALAGKVVKELKYSVFSGGGPGIMEAANRGAFESGGTSLGLTIRLPHEQVTNGYLSKTLDLYYFFVRKVMMSYSAEAFIFFPGGFGTLDEFFELVTLVQTKKIEGVPIICVGSDYWKSLERFMQENLISRGTISAEDLTLYTITDDLDEIIEMVRKVPLRTRMPLHLRVQAGTKDEAK